MKVLWLWLGLACPLAAQPSEDAAFVSLVENAIWNDHVDVRAPAYLLRRAGVDSGEVETGLIRILSSDPDASVRFRAAHLLGRMRLRNPRVVDALRKAGKDASPAVQGAARDALDGLEKGE